MLAYKRRVFPEYKDLQWTSLRCLEREPRLELQSAVVCGFRKSAETSTAACRLVRMPENRRGDVARDVARVVMVNQVFHLHRDDHVVTAPGDAACPILCGLFEGGAEVHRLADSQIE